jgi:hypothetical protein
MSGDEDATTLCKKHQCIKNNMSRDIYTIGAGIKALVTLLVSTVSKEDALFASKF